MVEAVDNALKAIEWRLARDEWLRQQAKMDWKDLPLDLTCEDDFASGRTREAFSSLRLDSYYLVFAFSPSSWSVTFKENIRKGLLKSLGDTSDPNPMRSARETCLNYARIHDAPLAFS